MDEHEFAEVVRLHRPALLGYARRIARTDAAAEDAVQQALLQAWVALQREDVDIREVRPWLYRIVHNTTVSALRRPRFEPFDGDAAVVSRPADAEFEIRQEVRETFAGLAALPELQRNVMLSTAVDGRSHEQIAAAYGLTKGAVRGLIYRARASLRAAVAAVTPAPVVAWLARHRVAPGHGAAAGEALAGAGAGSAGLAGVFKSGAIVVGIAASTGGAGYAVLSSHGPASVRHVSVRTAHHSPPAAREPGAGAPHGGAGAPHAAAPLPAGAGGSAPAGLIGLAGRPVLTFHRSAGDRRSHRDGAEHHRGSDGGSSGGSGSSASSASSGSSDSGSSTSGSGGGALTVSSGSGGRGPSDGGVPTDGSGTSGSGSSSSNNVTSSSGGGDSGPGTSSNVATTGDGGSTTSGSSGSGGSDSADAGTSGSGDGSGDGSGGTDGGGDGVSGTATAA